jgi:F-type H+-transporting ATPase subunit b
MLNLDLATILFQVVNFLVLAFLLNRFLFQPILRQAGQRAADKERLMEDLARERQQLASVRQELEQREEQLDEAKEAILTQVREQAEEEHRELLKQARAEAGQMLVEAQSDALRLQRQVMDQFREKLVDAVLDTCGTVIRWVAPPSVNDGLVLGLNERIREMGRTEMQRVEALRSSLTGPEPIAFITSARELTDGQQGQLAQILTALADQHVEMRMEVDRELVAGLRVRLGDTVIDDSIFGRLGELRDQVLSALAERMESA